MKRVDIKTKKVTECQLGRFCKVFYCVCDECGADAVSNNPKTRFCCDECCSEWHNREYLAELRAETEMFRKMREARIKMELSKDSG